MADANPLLDELLHWRAGAPQPAPEAWSPAVRIPSVPSRGVAPTPPPGRGLTVPQLIELHASGGRDAIMALPRHDIRRAVHLLGALSSDGRRVLHRESLVDDVLTVAASQVATRDVIRSFVPALLTAWPVNATARAYAAQLVLPSEAPWLAPLVSGNLTPLIAAIWSTMAENGPSAAIAVHRLPAQFWQGEWCVPVLQAGRGHVRTLALARIVLALGDGFPGLAQLNPDHPPDAEELARLAKSPISDGLREAIRTAVDAAEGFDAAGRRAIAAYVAKRVGDPFRGGPRWDAIETERIKVRSWLAARFLRAFFDQLRPAEASYQWQERADFWTDYAPHVTSMALFVGEDIRPRLRSPEILSLMADLGSAVRTYSLRGKGPDGAGLWMALQAPEGAATILEWNAKGAMRHSDGAKSPPTGTQTAEDLRSAAGYRAETHQGWWQGRFAERLSRYGIHKVRV